MAEYIEREQKCEDCIHAEVCDQSGRQMWGRMVGETECTDFKLAADVVEVVRCKECRHFCPYEGGEHKGDCNELVGLESCVYEDDFCSYGEAKMDGKGEG